MYMAARTCRLVLVPIHTHTHTKMPQGKNHFCVFKRKRITSCLDPLDAVPPPAADCDVVTNTNLKKILPLDVALLFNLLALETNGLNWSLIFQTFP